MPKPVKILETIVIASIASAIIQLVALAQTTEPIRLEPKY
jgi:hypothetical protein